MVSTKFHRRVDLLGAGEAFMQYKNRFIDHGYQHAVNDKAGTILNADGFFSELSGQCIHLGKCFI